MSPIWVVSFISGYKKCLQRSWAKDHVNFYDVDATWLHCDCVVGMHLQCFAQIDIDIGTTFLYFQCFFTTDMFLFCKTILYSGNCRIFRDLAFGSIQTRFKAILKKLEFSAQIDFCSFLEDAQSFKSQDIRVKVKRMYFVVRPCKPTKN